MSGEISLQSSALTRIFALIFAIAIVSLASPALSEDKSQFENTINGLKGCVFSSQDLEKPYQTAVQNRCFQVAFDLCSMNQETEECLQASTTAIDNWSNEIVARLPESIDATAIQMSFYTRTLSQLQDYPTKPSCEFDQKLDVALCKMRDAALRLADSLLLAEIAEIQE